MGQLPTIAWVSLAAYFALMLGIGLYAFRRAQATAEGYMLGGRDLGPAVTALSAGASDMSGWLLMGLPGAILIGGLSQAWIGIGLVIGAWANYHLVAPRLRTLTGGDGAVRAASARVPRVRPARSSGPREPSLPA